MKHYRLEAEAAVEFDIDSAFGWYEAEEPGLGLEFLEQLRLVYRRMLQAHKGTPGPKLANAFTFGFSQGIEKFILPRIMADGRSR